MNLGLLLLQMAVILAACRILRAAVKRLRQPAVMGEIIAGLLLGPSLFGWLAPSWYAQLFPASSLEVLHGLSQVGLVIFMFLVGLRLDLAEVTAFRKVAGLAAVLSVALPFVAGMALASWLYQLAPPSAARLPFALFVAVSMSITAFPVLARILNDTGLSETRIGHVAVSCAAANDVAAWCMLAAITALVKAGNGQASVVWPVASVLVYMLAMFGPVRLALRAAVGRLAMVGGDLAPIVIFVCLSGWIAERLGVHALFGAFLAGAVWPKRGAAAGDIVAKLEPVAMALLIPLFFSYTGLRTNIGLLGSGHLWIFEGVILAAAVIGKAGGAFAGAAATGFGFRNSLALGFLMNTRGLVELIVLNVGLDLGILSPELFSMMVLMALLTTLMTVPALWFVLPDIRHAARTPAAVRQARAIAS